MSNVGFCIAPVTFVSVVQADVFQEVSDLVQSALDGYKVRVSGGCAFILL